MDTLPLRFLGGHVFVQLGSALWLIDTGSPTSFGASRDLNFAGKHFRLPTGYLDLTVDALSRFVGQPCAGLLGTDVLGRFDHIFDAPRGTLTVSTAELSHHGERVPLDELVGIPVVTVRVRDSAYQAFFDTGAQISYLQDEALADFPRVGHETDFYPGFGQFRTDTYDVPVSLGGMSLTLRCGTLPGLLCTALMMAGAAGIVGNAVLHDRVVAYYPRRRLLGL